MMRLLFGTLLGLFITNCSAQDLSAYINIESDVSVKKTVQKNFEITSIGAYFNTVNSKNEKQIIASYREVLYKFDQQGNLIDSLSVPDASAVIFNIQPENHFIYLEDGYFPNWIKTGDKTKRKYDKEYNQDLTMDADVLKRYEEDVLNFEYKDPDKPIKEYYDFLDKKVENFELIKLLKNLNNQANYRRNVSFSTSYSSNIFVINDEVIKVNFPHELDYHSNKIAGENIGDNSKPELVVIPEFSEERKPFHFKKEEHIKRNVNILSTHNGGYWLGTAFYNMPIVKDTLKIKVENIIEMEENNIKIDRNIFPENKYFVLIEVHHGWYFIKEN
ncbi:hypothetical protein LZQ00_07635 [Sphingobacterium sp. SRCM116780]|uniref:hypothetical protein n=1 Tax=Sphingobacterium sp. SRCM116780 TaxID=2907623 RepID=UPI001F2593D2|nr:hypothetical protein [Sphingobacterium sp. SRCM116780]UIR57681.1 hypothetical protein LZQ00_07635 [Sphingobacterium sp. SRCM116780]